MGKAVPYEAGFPGTDDEIQKVIVARTGDVLGALVTQNSLMSVLLNSH